MPPKVQHDPADHMDALLEWIASGKTLTSYCAKPGHPSIATVWNWKRDDPAFAERFARAREAGAECYVEQAQDVADDNSQDWEEDEEGRPRLRSEHVQRSKLRVDTLLKRAANFCPHRFGSKVAVGGAADLPPIKAEPSGPLPPALPNLVADLAKLAELAREVVGDGDDDEG